MKPNLINIGAQKAGTTSFHNYLCQHPDVFMSNPKELNFFSNPKHWKKGHGWYEKHFNSDALIRGETSTSYTLYPRLANVPQRIAEYVPQAKLIYIIRDPISRLVSNYVHKVSLGREQRTLDELIDDLMGDRESPYILHGLYHLQLTQFLEWFDRDQILVVSTEELGKEMNRIMRTTFEFLDIGPLDIESAGKKSWNTAEARYRPSTLGKLINPVWLQKSSRIPWRLRSPFRKIARMVSSPIDKPKLNDSQIERLAEIFRDDVRALGNIAEIPRGLWRDCY